VPLQRHRHLLAGRQKFGGASAAKSITDSRNPIISPPSSVWENLSPAFFRRGEEMLSKPSRKSW
jgi:hypothetical protein